MAGIHFQPPEKFDFKQPDEWPRWLKRFEQFRIASGLSEESEKRQVNTLLYCLGEEGEDLLRSTNITVHFPLLKRHFINGYFYDILVLYCVCLFL